MATADAVEDSENVFWRHVANGDETADAMFQRIGRSSTLLKTGIRFLDEQMGIRSRDVVEIFGTSGAGKTELLLNIAVSTCLPMEFGGYCASCIFIDLDRRVDVQRLLRIVKEKCSYRLSNVDDMEEIVLKTLERIEIIRPNDSLEFLAALKVLEPTLSRMSQQYGKVRFVMIDGAGSYYWQDKSMRMDGSSIQKGIVREIEQLVALHDLPVIITKHVMLPLRRGRNAKENSDDFVDYQIKAWQDMIKMRLFLCTDTSSSLPLPRVIRSPSEVPIIAKSIMNCTSSLRWKVGNREKSRFNFIILDSGVTQL